MKNFRKITLGILLSAQVLGAFYGCSSDSLACVGQMAYNLSLQIDFCDNQYKACI